MTMTEYFNKYNAMSLEQLETRTAEIKSIIDKDPKADVAELSVELRAIKEAKDNIIEKRKQSKGFGYQPEKSASNPASSREYRSAFFKRLTNKPLESYEQSALEAVQAAMREKRADAYNTVSGSAAVLPTETLNEVFKKARTEGGIMASCRGFALPSKLSIPVGTPVDNSGWHTEGATIDRASLSTASVTFNANEIMKILSMTAAVESSDIGAFETYLVEELRASVMGTLEAGLVSGTGVAPAGKGFTAITWVTTTGTTQNALTYTKSGTPTYANFLTLAGLLKHGYAKTASWAMNYKTLLTHCYGLKDTTGRPLLISDIQQQPINYILGKPVVIDDNISDGDIYFGAFNFMAYNVPASIMVEMSRDSGFTSGLIDYRALMIADCKPVIEAAFTKMTEAAS